ncbi:P22AR C-terminal domain-containing protein [Glaesserella parasuis]|uniref:P22AR C-terminal domain-containing protein n=1 Tax=Glaesserella parasuis TaxID=738 RepID=UPI0024368C56|nr:P22AR C-terminal domain-containing protein [Glaesserella parasuis]MDG6474649.1 P22AR C-terminal domain-containing protein [Glaesserella parasuis]MDP0354072.1 P22AR C-terminal domain-containing protein [Glaesserella parasuis]
MSNNQISIFNFKSNPVRVEIFEQQPHFCLLDVCSVFEIQNSRRVQSEMLDPQGVRQAYILAKDEKQRKTSFINEPNLYRIIFRSEKPIAKEFQNWVFEEVLPQIRKTGQYSVQQQLALPEPEKKYTFEFTEYELEQLTWLSFSHKQMNNLLGLLIQPLEALGSRYSASVYSHHHEYKRHYTESLDTIKRLTEPFKKSDRLNWKRVIHRLTA